MSRFTLALVGIAVATASASGADDDALKHALALEATIQKITERVEPSVACILVSRSDGYAKLARGQPQSREPGKLGGFEPPPEPNFRKEASIDFELMKRLNLAAPDVVPDSYGSGVVIDAAKGLILTNLHVVRGATKIFVRLPGLTGSYANIHAADERSDLAVLQLINRPAGLRELPLGDADKLKKGQFVLAIANPFAAGFRDGSPSVSWGLLSNIRRRLPGEPSENEKRRPRLHYYGVLLQTDLRLNLGSSGGALVDLHGNWIGLTTSLAALAGGESAGGYAMPLDTRMKRIIGKLRAGLEVEYGFLGINLIPSGGFGGVSRPTHGGPAEKAGMREGDQILSIDGHPIRDQDDLLLNISVALAGTEVRMVVRSAFGERELRPVLVKTSWRATGPIIAANRPPPVHGLRVDYTSIVFEGTVGQNAIIKPGVMVREVVDGSPAAKAELRPELDVIEMVNAQRVNSPKEFYDAVGRANGPIELTLHETGRRIKLP